MVGMVDSEHVVFVGRDPEKAGEPTETTEIERMEWVPLASVPEYLETSARIRTVVSVSQKQEDPSGGVGLVGRATRGAFVIG
jgi:hypothetical protein